MATDHYYSIAKIRRDLGWQPKVSLLEGIKRTAEGVRAAGKV
jgi:nucleoside-diphosphate-sugar epimerase